MYIVDYNHQFLTFLMNTYITDVSQADNWL